MNYSLLKRGMFLLAVVLFIFSFTSCSTTGGAVGLEWGHETGNGHHHKVKKAKKGGPPPHAPAHGYRAKYNYRYYPSCRVYYDDYRKLYFYLEGDNWRISASLPHALQLGLGGYVSIEMDEDKPYIYYEEHKRKYPSGQFKNKYKRKNK
ncbi:MAG: hypothetical protein PVJ20_13305 [Desulfobacterales bacterium]|jgi:hypothetical protein